MIFSSSSYFFKKLIVKISTEKKNFTGSYGSSGSSSSAQTSLSSAPNGNSNGNNGECRDYTGRAIQHAMHFVPPGVDMCKLCSCENGHAKVRVSKKKYYKLLYDNLKTSTELPCCFVYTTTRL